MKNHSIHRILVNTVGALSSREGSDTMSSLMQENVESLYISTDISDLHSAHYTRSEIDDFKRYFAMVNDTLDTMTDYYTKLGVDNPAFYCRFYSMEQSSTISFADQTMQMTFTEKLLRFMCQQEPRTSGTNWY